MFSLLILRKLNRVGITFRIDFNFILKINCFHNSIIVRVSINCQLIFNIIVSKCCISGLESHLAS